MQNDLLNRLRQMDFSEWNGDVVACLRNQDGFEAASVIEEFAASIAELQAKIAELEAEIAALDEIVECHAAGCPHDMEMKSLADTKSLARHCPTRETWPETGVAHRGGPPSRAGFDAMRHC